MHSFIFSLDSGSCCQHIRMSRAKAGTSLIPASSSQAGSLEVTIWYMREDEFLIK